LVWVYSGYRLCSEHVFEAQCTVKHVLGCMNTTISYSYYSAREVIHFILYVSPVILNTGMNRVMGGPVTAAHQPAEIHGHSQPVAATRHMGELHE